MEQWLEGGGIGEAQPQAPSLAVRSLHEDPAQITMGQGLESRAPTREQHSLLGTPPQAPLSLRAMTFSQATLEGGVAYKMAPTFAHFASSPVSTGELGAADAQAKGSDGGAGATRFHLPLRAQDRHSSCQ